MVWVLLYDKFTLGVSVVGSVCLGWVCRWVGLSWDGFFSVPFLNIWLLHEIVYYYSYQNAGRTYFIKCLNFSGFCHFSIINCIYSCYYILDGAKLVFTGFVRNNIINF